MASLDSVMAPEAALDDGLTHITFNQTMGRMRATQILLQLEGPDVSDLVPPHIVWFGACGVRVDVFVTVMC